MQRCIEPEWLDQLPSEDAGAVGSRHDLRRLNAWMGNVGIMARALLSALQQTRSPRLIELGAGDGHFMLKVARKLSRRWQPKQVILVDQRPAGAFVTCRALAALGWPAQPVIADAFQWLQHERAPEDAIIGNLFLHHFDRSRLAELFELIARLAVAFVGVEPRRSRLALSFSRMTRLIGCNAVTRHDAPASVRAGFTGQELSSAWPNPVDWELRETPAGLFSHLFVARRANATFLSLAFPGSVQAASG